MTYMSCKARDALGSRSLNVTAVTRKLRNADYNEDSSPEPDVSLFHGVCLVFFMTVFLWRTHSFACVSSPVAAVKHLRSVAGA